MFHITARSKNMKTGPILVTTSTAKTCPDACPLKKNGCYAELSQTKYHWRHVTEGKHGTEWNEFISTLSRLLPKLDGKKLWRHNQAGDLPGANNRINRRQAIQLAVVNKKSGARGWTYTHKPMTMENAETVRQMNKIGFTVNLSGNSVADADRLADLGVAPVVTILPSDTQGNRLKTPAGRQVIVCPAQRIEGMTCDRCGLCESRHPRRPIIGFLAHGVSKKKVSEIARKQ